MHSSFSEMELAAVNSRAYAFAKKEGYENNEVFN